MTEHNPMTAPLRRTPVRFRWWLAGCLVALVAAFSLLHAFAPDRMSRRSCANPGRCCCWP